MKSNVDISSDTGGKHDATPRVNSLAEDLEAVLSHANGRSITLRELVDVLRERGLALILLLFTIPFLLPVPTLGLSTPAGLAVAGYGLCILLSVRPWLPKFLAKREISYHALEKTVHCGARVGRRIERLLKPRLKFMLWPGINALIGACLMITGILMALPLPIPFTNAIPAIGIVLLLLGLLERDGVFVIAGQIATMLIVGVFVTLGFLIYEYGWTGLRAMIAAM